MYLTFFFILLEKAVCKCDPGCVVTSHHHCGFCSFHVELANICCFIMTPAVSEAPAATKLLMLPHKATCFPSSFQLVKKKAPRCRNRRLEFQEWSLELLRYRLVLISSLYAG